MCDGLCVPIYGVALAMIVSFKDVSIAVEAMGTDAYKPRARAGVAGLWKWNICFWRL